MSGKSLMTQYIEGSIVSRELRDMLNDQAAEARFEREIHEGLNLYADKAAAKPYGRDAFSVKQRAKKGELKP